MVVEDCRSAKTPKRPVPADESGIMLNFVFAVGPSLQGDHADNETNMELDPEIKILERFLSKGFYMSMHVL